MSCLEQNEFHIVWAIVFNSSVAVLQVVSHSVIVEVQLSHSLVVVVQMVSHSVVAAHAVTHSVVFVVANRGGFSFCCLWHNYISPCIDRLVFCQECFYSHLTPNLQMIFLPFHTILVISSTEAKTDQERHFLDKIR